MKPWSRIIPLLAILLSVFGLQSAFSQSVESGLLLNSIKEINLPARSGVDARPETDTHLSIQSVMQKSEKEILFVENIGQIRDSNQAETPDVLFLTRSQDVDMYITSSGLTYVFHSNPVQAGMADKTARYRLATARGTLEPPQTRYCRLDMEFVGMNENCVVKKERVVSQQSNYYTPEFPDGISPKAFEKITIYNIYDGIDLVYYEKDGNMKYDFMVAAGADINQIKMKYNSAISLYVDDMGRMVATTPLGEVREGRPYTFSQRTGLPVENVYKVTGNVVQFDVADYNNTEDIVIDPVREWATYYGGTGGDYGRDICTDNSGNLYVTGYTYSSDFPVEQATDAYNQIDLGGDADIFITKFNSGGERIWSTYYGSGEGDYGFGICTDNSGNLYVTGSTASYDFPTQFSLPGFNQASYGGGWADVIILKFDSEGSRLWGTFYGGNGGDSGYGVCTDGDGALYITGYTTSSNFPTQALSGAYNQGNHAGSYDAFILKFSSNESRLWATYYGGNQVDEGSDVCLDSTGALYVTGYTYSTNLPTFALPGAYYQASFGGGLADAYILKFDSGCARVWATYYGGTLFDEGTDVCTDSSGNLYVTGSTRSSNFPVEMLPGAYNQTVMGGNTEVHILKFDSSGARLWATYYGGNSVDFGASLSLDSSDALYVTGRTESSNFPTQAVDGAYNQANYAGVSDAFILNFDSNGVRQWATYYGGTDFDRGKSIWGDNTGNIFVTGSTVSTSFPLKYLDGAYNQNHAGNADLFVLKFNSSPATGVGDNSPDETPQQYSLLQNYPNPFNPMTTIEYRLPKACNVKLVIYNLDGKKVRTLINTQIESGHHQVVWNGRNEMGVRVASGVYLYRLDADQYHSTQKMILTK